MFKKKATPVYETEFTRTVVKTVTRLTPEVFEQFIKQFPNQYISKETTELQASYYLGINHVINELRKGIVIETTSTN